jgi:hypothetical protein
MSRSTCRTRRAAIADGNRTGTITDDDPLPALTINDVSVAEGDTGSVAAMFTVASAVSGRNVPWLRNPNTPLRPATTRP